ncbi:MAG: mechanosensitive ion channel family protein [Treponema sp.]|jgi:miniconductance mechanosensitive channel|nr:mechanosensitive ion channel family protein [Treponema sp.]
MTSIITDLLERFWEESGLPGGWIGLFNETIALLIFIAVVLITAKLSSTLILLIVHRMVKKTKTTWDDTLMESRFFIRLSRLLPAIAAYILIPAFLTAGGGMSVFVCRLTVAYIAGMSAHICAAFLNAINLIYRNDAGETAKRKPIKGYIQLAKVFLYIIGGILVVTTLLNVSPLGILSGIGAMSAVLMLVFKDSILGFVSSMQLSGNDMVRIGDWIEMPAYNADGDVIDITLQSVKVQNWDKTITAIPIYALVSDSFKNWRGMSDSGGRRIKRSIYIDMRSVRFLTEEEIGRLSALPPLAAYMKSKLAEITEYNKARAIPEDDYVSGRHLTNLGTYRAYTEAYLNALPQAAKGMTNMVRYLQPDGNGLQMEIYLFSADTSWVRYERIQADITDHLAAILSEFGLKAFQNPSGGDVQLIAEALGACGKAGMP